eukprot:g35379.t1
MVEARKLETAKRCGRVAAVGGSGEALALARVNLASRECSSCGNRGSSSPQQVAATEDLFPVIGSSIGDSKEKEICHCYLVWPTSDSRPTAMLLTHQTFYLLQFITMVVSHRTFAEVAVNVLLMKE